MTADQQIPNVLAGRYASADMVGIWSPAAKIILERRLWIAVMRAQADDFFSGHDDDPTICTQERAEQDARTVFKQYKPARKNKR